MFANDKGSWKVNYPLSKDDWKVDGELMCEDKPGKSRKYEGTMTIESPDMSGANMVMNLTATQEQKGADLKNEDPNVAFDMCVNVEKDWYIGMAGEHNTKEMSGLEAAAMKRDGDNKYWLGYNHDDE